MGNWTDKGAAGAENHGPSDSPPTPVTGGHVLEGQSLDTSEPNNTHLLGPGPPPRAGGPQVQSGNLTHPQGRDASSSELPTPAG